MFKALSALGLGKATNVQEFSNQTGHTLKIEIKAPALTWNCEIAPYGVNKIDATRDEIGEIWCAVIVDYSNGGQIKYHFSISPKNMVDKILIYDTYVMYNGMKRGHVMKESILVPEVVINLKPVTKPIEPSTGTSIDPFDLSFFDSTLKAKVEQPDVEESQNLNDFTMEGLERICTRKNIAYKKPISKYELIQLIKSKI